MPTGSAEMYIRVYNSKQSRIATSCIMHRGPPPTEPRQRTYCNVTLQLTSNLYCVLHHLNDVATRPVVSVQGHDVLVAVLTGREGSCQQDRDTYPSCSREFLRERTVPPSPCSTSCTSTS